MIRRVYIETTVVSYLTAWRSPQLLMAAQQQATRDWWDGQRANFDLVVSELVLQEAAAGDPNAAERRLHALKPLKVLQFTDGATALARTLVGEAGIPTKAQLDALHIAIAAFHGVDYLLTWNCRHIANAAFRDPIRSACASAGFTAPIICTPLELFDGDYDHVE